MVIKKIICSNNNIMNRPKPLGLHLVFRVSVNGRWSTVKQTTWTEAVGELCDEW